MVDGKKPVFSMTGFGAGEARITGGRVRVEVKSVNHRYLDVTVKGPREYVSLETRVLEAVRARLKRGKVDVFVTRAVDPGESGAVKANVPLARGWKDALETLRRELSLSGEVTLAMIAGQRDIILAGGEDADPERDWSSIEKALAEAIDKNAAMRAEEGRRTLGDLRSLAAELARLAALAEARAPKVVEEYRTRLVERLKKLLADTTMEPARMEQEVAVLADRTDVHEELVRLHGHLDQLNTILDGGGEIGRRLDFLLQEIGRETNTLGSKANDAELGRVVVDLKATAERIREQIQNVE